MKFNNLKFLKNSRGISLVEVLIAISLFAAVAVISSGILIDIVRIEKRASIRVAVFSELQTMLQALTTEIQNGTIDYEEYYNYYVIQEGDVDGEAYFGLNHGVYGSRFYDPGKSLVDDPTSNPANLGFECSYPEVAGIDTCEVIYTLSTDLNTGQNPFYGNPADSNAFCDMAVGCDSITGETDHLFLIDNTGTQKTIITLKKTNNIPESWAIGLVRMRGMDIDQNGIVDSFTCLTDEFDCFGGSDDPELVNYINLPYEDIIEMTTHEVVTDPDNPIYVPRESDLDDVFEQSGNNQFTLISSMKADIKDLRFIIYPLEDPYKGFAEPTARAHPSVTILLTVGLSAEAEKAYPGEFKQITVRTTVSAGVIGRIDTYPPVNEVSTVGSWIMNVSGITPVP